MLRYLSVIAFLCLSFAAVSQNIPLKTDLDSKAKFKLNFQSTELEGTLRAHPDHIDLKMTNTSAASLAFKNGDFLLTSARGVGEELCSDELVIIAPGKKVSIILERCKDSDRVGLFGLKPSYKSKESFISESTFLIDQEFILTIGTHKVRFYTDL